MSIEVSLGTRGTIWLALLVFAIPAGITVYVISANKTLNLLGFQTGILMAFYTLLFVGALFLLKGSIIIDDDSLYIRSPINKHEYRLSDVRLRHAFELTGEEAKKKKLTLRTWGVGLPGFLSGSFKTADQSDVAVLSATKDRVYIPTDSGPDIIIDAEAFSQLNAQLGYDET